MSCFRQACDAGNFWRLSNTHDHSRAFRPAAEWNNRFSLIPSKLGGSSDIQCSAGRQRAVLFNPLLSGSHNCRRRRGQHLGHVNVMVVDVRNTLDSCK